MKILNIKKGYNNKHLLNEEFGVSKEIIVAANATSNVFFEFLKEYGKLLRDKIVDGNFASKGEFNSYKQKATILADTRHLFDKGIPTSNEFSEALLEIFGFEVYIHFIIILEENVKFKIGGGAFNVSNEGKGVFVKFGVTKEKLLDKNINPIHLAAIENRALISEVYAHELNHLLDKSRKTEKHSYLTVLNHGISDRVEFYDKMMIDKPNKNGEIKPKDKNLEITRDFLYDLGHLLYLASDTELRARQVQAAFSMSNGDEATYEGGVVTVDIAKKLIGNNLDTHYNPILFNMFFKELFEKSTKYGNDKVKTLFAQDNVKQLLSGDAHKTINDPNSPLDNRTRGFIKSHTQKLVNTHISNQLRLAFSQVLNKFKLDNIEDITDKQESLSYQINNIINIHQDNDTDLLKVLSNKISRLGEVALKKINKAKGITLKGQDKLALKATNNRGI
jgi:hypothetical protein